MRTPAGSRDPAAPVDPALIHPSDWTSGAATPNLNSTQVKKSARRGEYHTADQEERSDDKNKPWDPYVS